MPRTLEAMVYPEILGRVSAGGGFTATPIKKFWAFKQAGGVLFRQLTGGGCGMWGWLGLVVYRVFFLVLVFSVCVAIYFEYGGLADLCPNGGSVEPAANAKPAANADAKPGQAQRQARRQNCIYKFPARRQRPRICDDSSYTTQASTSTTQAQAHKYALTLFNTI